VRQVENLSAAEHPQRAPPNSCNLELVANHSQKQQAMESLRPQIGRLSLRKAYRFLSDDWNSRPNSHWWDQHFVCV